MPLPESWSIKSRAHQCSITDQKFSSRELYIIRNPYIPLDKVEERQQIRWGLIFAYLAIFAIRLLGSVA